MFDKGLDILEKYDFEVLEITKGRGVLILNTTKGPKILKEYKGSGKHLVWSQEIFEKADFGGRLLVDSCVRNNEGEFISESMDKSRYIVKNWYNCRDCDVKNMSDILMSVRALAILHNELEKCEGVEALYNARSYTEEMEGHNKEIKRIKKYLKGKNNRTEFELEASGYCDVFYEEGRRAIEEFKEFIVKEQPEMGICHGDYNFHNICFAQNVPVILNFDKQNYNYLMSDLYRFMRKILEKGDWNIELGLQLINEYDKERTISETDRKLLVLFFSYPEKFWKILNGYFNSNKAWIPQKKLEKLRKFVGQNERRLEFIRTIYS